MRYNHCFFQASTPLEEYFIVKQKTGDDALTAKEAIRAHIANNIYRLFGVLTPELYIGEYQGNLSLFSQVLPDYKDLAEWLSGDKPLQQVNQYSNVDACITAYEELERNLSIQNKEALLAAAIILEDGDVIGAGFRNIGLIEEDGEHHIVKIDPDDSIFDQSYANTVSALSEFQSHLSTDNPLLYDIFSMTVICNNPKSILGNLHLSEFFHSIDQARLISTFDKFIHLKNDDIKKLIFREEYIELLGSDDAKNYLEHLCSIIIGKKEILQKLLNPNPKTVETPDPSPVFMKDKEFSEPLETIPYGASKPVKVRVIKPMEETLRHQGKEPSQDSSSKLDTAPQYSCRYA